MQEIARAHGLKSVAWYILDAAGTRTSIAKYLDDGLRTSLQAAAGMRQGDTLFIAVRDNGQGFDSDAFDLGEVVARQEDGVGLKNIHQRLKLNYGDAYGIEVSSRPGEGTIVTLRLPARGEDESAWLAL